MCDLRIVCVARRRAAQIVGGDIVSPCTHFDLVAEELVSSPRPFGSLVALTGRSQPRLRQGGRAITLLINWDDVTVTDPAVGEVREVSPDNIYDHPDYDRFTLENDVSLLYFDQPSSYRPVSLDDGSYSAIEQMGPVLGWGRTNNNPPINWPDRPRSRRADLVGIFYLWLATIKTTTPRQLVL